MVLKSEKESRLLGASKAFDDAISHQQTSELKRLLAENVTFHHDGLTIGQDLHGQDAVTDWLAAYWKRYDYQHEVVTGAVDPNDNIAFSFWMDKGVKPKSKEAVGGDVPEAALKPSDVVGIFHHVFDDQEKIKDIWYMRQLSKDELHRKLKHFPDQQIQFDPSSFKNQSIKPSEERAQKQEQAARQFNEIWAKGDASIADSIMAQDVTIYDPLLGKQTNSRDDFKKMIEGFSKNWETKENKSHIAVTPGNSAFISWMNKGTNKAKGNEDQLYGLNLLAFNEDCKITKVVGFRQLTKEEQEEMVKPELHKAEFSPGSPSGLC